jgi:hypothetical protein
MTGVQDTAVVQPLPQLRRLQGLDVAAGVLDDAAASSVAQVTTLLSPGVCT